MDGRCVLYLHYLTGVLAMRGTCLCIQTCKLLLPHARPRCECGVPKQGTLPTFRVEQARSAKALTHSIDSIAHTGRPRMATQGVHSGMSS